MPIPIRILILEDSEDDEFLLIREIRRAGYEPTHIRVETAEAMRAALEAESWDFIISDYSMHGFNALNALLILSESGLDLPFIIVSGTIGEERAVAAMKAGAHDFLEKENMVRLSPVIARELREAKIRQERREATETLKERERYFRALIENNGDIIITLDPKGRIIYASPAIGRNVGSSHSEFVGVILFSLLHPDDLDENVRLFNHLLRKAGETVNTQFRIQNQDGDWLWMEAIMSNLLDEPGIDAVVVNLRDVTERYQLQAQLLQAQKMEAVGQLTAGIAHDFNNMLTVINSYAELLLMRLPKDEGLHKMADRILEGGERAANLVDRLLTFSRKQVVHPQILALNEIVTSMEKMLREIIGEHISMSTNLAPDLWSIKADPTQISQVIVNLAVNARDAMPTGGELTIYTANKYLDKNTASSYVDLLPGPHVLLTFNDTGMGMSDEVKSHLFEPFYTTKEEGKGTGLGLATVYGIVKQSGGHIVVESEIGRGTTINICFPRVESEEMILLEGSAVIDYPAADETILVVEDNYQIRELVNEILGGLGYIVLTAHNGEKALEVAGNHEGQIDLLLTDIVMPGFSGRVLAERLLANHPEIKVLFMSGYSEETIADFGVESPKLALLQKPYNPQELANKVREVLDGGQGQFDESLRD